MDKQRRKELVEQYNQIKVYMGVYKITNTSNGKIFIDSFPNLKNYWMKLQWQLDMGKFPNFELQKDWTSMGKDVFTYEVLEEKEVKEDMDARWETKQMEKAWLERLKPYGEKGYNRLAK